MNQFLTFRVLLYLCFIAFTACPLATTSGDVFCLSLELAILEFRGLLKAPWEFGFFCPSKKPASPPWYC